MLSAGTLLAQFICGFSLYTLHHSIVFSVGCGIAFEIVYLHMVDEPVHFAGFVNILIGVAMGMVHVRLSGTKRFHPMVEAMNKRAMIKRVVWEVILLAACRHAAGETAGPFAFPTGITNGAVRFLGCALALFMTSGDVTDIIRTWSDYSSYCAAHFLWILNCMVMYFFAFCLYRSIVFTEIAVVCVPIVTHVAVRAWYMAIHHRRTADALCASTC